jgi:hypothetical protein
MFRDPMRSTPFISDIADVALKLKVQRADSALFAACEFRLPQLRVM